MKKIYLFAWLLLFPLLGPAQSRGDLLSDTIVMSLDKTEIQSIYAGFSLPEILFPIHFETVDIHRIVYWTLNGRGDSLTVASGLVTVPVNHECAFPLVNYNHGSLVYDEVLSEFNAKLNQHFIGVPFAANGYVAVLPDLLGLGATPLDHPHPYVHARSEATAVIDMLRAARQLCSAAAIGLNDELFLLGYSQGGHTTMATHKYLQEEYADEFTVTASAPCSGPYDLSGIMYDSILFSDYFSNPFFIAYVTASYQYIYQNLYDDISEIFQSPYDTLITRMLNRAHPESHLRDSLPTPGVQMFQPDYLAEIIANPNHPFRQDVRDNDLYNWLPEAPVRLYYCTADEQIPYVNALFTADTMAALGADIQAINAGPYDHFDCTPFALVGAKLWFDTYRTPCMIGTDELADEGLHLTPNPFDHALTITMLQPGSGYLQLYDAVGRLAFAGSVQDGQTLYLPDGALPPGIYIAVVEVDGKIYRRKMIRADRG